MLRKEFIRTCCVAGLSGSLVATLLESCAGSKIVSASIEGSDLMVPAGEFEMEKTNPVHFRKYLIVQNDRLEYPICLYRHDESHYTALWMRCTHQGTELQVFGDKLHCPAHGSEFNSDGSVGNGPAAEPLRTFGITVSQTQIKISLT